MRVYVKYISTTRTMADGNPKFVDRIRINTSAIETPEMPDSDDFAYHLMFITSPVLFQTR